MRRVFATAVALGLLMVLALPAWAITRGGSLDEDDHPYVGFMVAFAADGSAWRCSGTLVEEDLFLTAGHCTYGAVEAYVWFQSDLDAAVEEAGSLFAVPFVTGTAESHPSYDDDAFYLYDLGVVKLDQPVAGIEPAEVTDGSDLASLGKGRKAATVTAVGYGLQEFVEGPFLVGPEAPDEDGNISWFDPKYRADWVRYQADLMVVNSKGVGGLGSLEDIFPGSGSFFVSGDAKHGGTCFGDSGGPMLVGDTVVGVNSFGLNRNCAGVGGAYEINDEDLEWLASLP